MGLIWDPACLSSSQSKSSEQFFKGIWKLISLYVINTMVADDLQLTTQLTEWAMESAGL